MSLPHVWFTISLTLRKSRRQYKNIWKKWFSTYKVTEESVKYQQNGKLWLHVNTWLPWQHRDLWANIYHIKKPATNERPSKREWVGGGVISLILCRRINPLLDVHVVLTLCSWARHFTVPLSTLDSGVHS